MASTGFSLVQAGANNADAGSVAWSSPGSVTADDGTTASATLSGVQDTQYLHATNPNYTVPSGATIDGVEVKIEKLTNSGNMKDETIQLIKGGVRSGTNKADTATNWPTTADTKVVHGGPTDLWGLSLTDTDVNASNFGVAIQAKQNSGGITRWCAVDVVFVNVYYTTGGGGSASVPIVHLTGTAA